MWHFRVKVPENLPPFFRDTIGEISYFLHAYLDHDRYTRGTCEMLGAIVNQIHLTD